MEPELCAELSSIEQDLRQGVYKKGRWSRVLAQVRALPASQRRALGDQVTRVSDLMHRRKGYPRLPLGVALSAEVAAGLAGAALADQAARRRSTVLAMAALGLGATSLEPLVKIAVGAALGIGYSDAYLWKGVEPRFKMQYGSYLAACRGARATFQLTGTLGSPFAAAALARKLRGKLPVAARICEVAFWLGVGTNLVFLGAGLLGQKKVLGVPVSASSAGAAARELLAATE